MVELKSSQETLPILRTITIWSVISYIAKSERTHRTEYHLYRKKQKKLLEKKEI